MARTHDPLIRKAKQDCMAPQILEKNCQLLIERQLRLVWRINELQPHLTRAERARTDATGAHPQASDTPSITLLFRMWERYHDLNESSERDEAAVNQVMGHIARLTSELDETKNKAFQQILQIVEHNRKMQEHNDNLKMQAEKLKLDPSRMSIADLEALVAQPDPDPTPVSEPEPTA